MTDERMSSETTKGNIHDETFSILFLLVHRAVFPYPSHMDG